ncbi:hypothetical protein ABZ804_09275 [Streptomyces sp. NPDC047726]|uniref:hypothetical protein n=1 Tax=Streptomyces sp. NPDC047726 TaxID=3156651 RepID=UPI0033F06EB9
MTNEQPPRDDEQDDEPTVMEYTRADASKFPTTLAGQQASAEGMAAAKGWTSVEISRAVRARRTEPALAEFREHLVEGARQAPELQAGILRAVVDLVDNFTADRAGSVADDAPADVLSRAALVNLARDHRTVMRPDVGGQAYDDLVEEIADTFTLSDVRIMRGAWTAITEAMPRIAYVARQGGKSPDEIAQATGYTSSRIAQFIRQEKERAAAVPLTRYTFRVDVMGPDGEWTDRETGEEELDPNNLPAEANRLLDESGARTGRARIFLWEGDEGDDADAAHTVDRTRH